MLATPRTDDSARAHGRANPRGRSDRHACGARRLFLGEVVDLVAELLLQHVAQRRARAAARADRAAALFLRALHELERLGRLFALERAPERERDAALVRIH